MRLVVSCLWFCMLQVGFHRISAAFLPRFPRVRKSRLVSRMSSTKKESPSADRNKEPIWNVLQTKWLSPKMTASSTETLQVLEIAAGAGGELYALLLLTKLSATNQLTNPVRISVCRPPNLVHSHFFASKLLESNVSFRWSPSDPETTSLASIDAYIEDERNERLRASVASPLQLTLDVEGIVEESTRSQFTPASLDLVMAINLIHISPWSATLGLMKTAGGFLKDDGMLYLYGPYRVGGACVESNL
jgi:hypothetical protein